MCGRGLITVCVGWSCMLVLCVFCVVFCAKKWWSYFGIILAVGTLLAIGSKAIKNQFTATFNQRGPNNYYLSEMIAYHGNSGVILDFNSLTW